MDIIPSSPEFEPVSSLTSIPTELTVGKFTTTEFADFIEALARPKTIVPTHTERLVKKLIAKNRSAIVSIPDGGGKTVILKTIGDLLWEVSPMNSEPLTEDDEALLTPDEPEWVLISDCPDVGALIKVLWEWEGCPVPTFSEFWDKGKGKGIWSKQKDGLTCFFADESVK